MGYVVINIFNMTRLILDDGARRSVSFRLLLNVFDSFLKHGRNRSSRSTPPTRRRSDRALREEGRRFFCVAQQESSSAADKERSAKYTLEMEGEGSEGWRPPTK